MVLSHSRIDGAILEDNVKIMHRYNKEITELDSIET